MRRFWQWMSCFFGAHEEWYLIARTEEDPELLWPKTTLLYECYACKRHKTLVLDGLLKTPVPAVHTPAARNAEPKTSRWKA